MSKVYIKVNSKDEIIDINSSIFLEDTKGYIEIDEGSGDRYDHAQGNYLPFPIRDEDGNNRFKYHHGYPKEDMIEKLD